MATYIQKGNIIDYTNSGATKIAAGDVVGISTRIGIAASDIAVGEVGTLAVEGVFEINKTASLAISVGDAVYFNVGTAKITATDTDVPAGWAIAAAAAADTTVRVKIG